MIRNTSMSRGCVWLCLILGVLLVYPSQAAERERRERPRRERTTNRRNNERQEKKQLPTEGTDGLRQIQTVLKEILTAVNRNEKPAPATLTSAGQLLDENKRYLQLYDQDQRADFMLTQAWTHYYAGELDMAMNWALRASKTEDSNQDAWVSAAIFCMLNDKKPILPRPKQTSRTKSRDRDEDAPRSEEPQYNLRKGTLDFDVLSLRQEMFTDRFDFGSTFGEIIRAAQMDNNNPKTLCLFLWKSEGTMQPHDEAPGMHDPNEPGSRAERPHGKPPERDTMEGPSSMSASSGPSLPQQQMYFKQIARVCRKTPSMMFFQINTDLPDQAAKIAARETDEEFVKTELLAGTYVPVAFAAEVGLPPELYTGLNATGPFMLVVSPDGKLRYAGPAADFVPVFILTAVTGELIDVQALNEKPDRFDDRRMPPHMRRDRDAGDAIRPIDPNLPGSDPNKLSDPNVPAMMPAAARPSRPVELSAEDCYKAEQLLSQAQLQIEASRDIRGKSPKKGIEACRQVMKQYPNTQYAVQAKDLLRRVPERLKKKYGITAEELE